MKIFTSLAIVAVVSAEFSCIKPVNPIPAGPPGVCCEKLDQSALLGFLYTGKSCMFQGVPKQLWSKLLAGLRKQGMTDNELEIKVSEQTKWTKPRVERQHIALVNMGGKQLVVTRYVYIK